MDSILSRHELCIKCKFTFEFMCVDSSHIESEIVIHCMWTISPNHCVRFSKIQHFLRCHFCYGKYEFPDKHLLMHNNVDSLCHWECACSRNKFWTENIKIQPSNINRSIFGYIKHIKWYNQVNLQQNVYDAMIAGIIMRLHSQEINGIFPALESSSVADIVV